MSAEQKIIIVESSRQKAKDKAKPPVSAKEPDENLQCKELADELAELNRSVQYWDMSQTHSCIYPF